MRLFKSNDGKSRQCHGQKIKELIKINIIMHKVFYLISIINCLQFFRGMAQTKLKPSSRSSIIIFDRDRFNTDYLHHIKEVIKGNGLSELSKMQDALDRSDNDYTSFLNHFYSISHNSERESFLASYKDIKYNAQQ
ncbi:hypothetical protein KMW28_23045 [Flammeovirga yaeyamensis]|uniref:Uncharacterized protein n=1 Tax=Flammeovirga yaeyamensis TaxID=367791 RepID=A0AAX1NE17_9BACT|nr:hypothetical protein [Flammeovirga yaeyamensis]MBB3696757.1 hypothetical protein [Flammeovirga yaeyamensis]NMF33424.1 hypothetical protein [Flammeovirga yaeyamensis]QWG05301.1 hypothetical protein KMW28_23045 [Flammeovirga yaeyamensis]